MRDYLTLQQVAAKLRKTPAWLRRHLEELQAGGFPPPALTAGRLRLWDPKALELWQDSTIPAELRDQAAAAADPVKAAERALLAACDAAE